MTTKKLFTPAEVIDARAQIIHLTHDQMIAKGYVNIQAVLADASSFEVVLTSAEGKVIQAIKEVRTITGMSLAEAKHLVDNSPSVVLTGTDADAATDALHRLRSAGVTASIRRIQK